MAACTWTLVNVCVAMTTDDDLLWQALTTRSTLPAGIGPHEGREIELLLAGAKPVAMFTDFVPECGIIPDEELAPLLHEGRLVGRNGIFDGPNGGKVRLLAVAQSDASDRLDMLFELMRAIYEGRRPYDESADRQIGQLLGYTDADIESFIIWQRCR